MIDRSRIDNAFHFVTVSSARARQLLKGCVPRVEGDEKLVKLAQREVLAGEIEPLDEPLRPQTP